ncbi:hypothetical protein BKA61DRAFT_612471 [Leptodontidium sp. MPI-SDFR-AT-0119]|nr:hypothetical protein BKA61DRAFT_612471 [Leptodontidium sp. MPI-SDFR-AT-0119]
MASFDLDHKTASNDEIAAYCSNPNYASLSEACYDNHVVKLSEEAVVKFGIGVKEEEAKGLRRAYELVDHDIVRIPLVYRFFIKAQQGYIVMEYMQGRVIKSIKEPGQIERIADILAYLTTIRGSIPGPLVVECQLVSFGLYIVKNPFFILLGRWKVGSIGDYGNRILQCDLVDLC